MKRRMISMAMVLTITAFTMIGCGEAQEDTGSLESTEKGDAQETVSTDGGTVDYSGMTIAWSPANLTNELQVSLTDTLKEEMDKLGCKLLVSDPSSDSGLQVEQVSNYIAQNVDMILMSPVDAAACGVVVTDAKDAGIPMMIVNCMMDNMDEALCYVGCDVTTAGVSLMEYLVKCISGSGNIGILRGPDGLDAQIKRTAGIDTVLAENKDVKVFDSQAADWKTAEAMSITENWLQNTTLDAVVCENDEMAIGVVEAIKGQGLSCEDVIVVGIDGIPSAIESIAKGDMKATLLQDAEAIAVKTVEVMQTYFEDGEEAVEDEYIIPWTLIDENNIAEFQ